MGLFKRLVDSQTKPLYSSTSPRSGEPEWPAEICGVKLHGKDTATIDVRVFTGEETPWQGPGRRTIRTLFPESSPPQIGQRVLIQQISHGNVPPYVHWEKPAPDLPPMTFPSNMDGNDPLTALKQLAQMVDAKTLPQDDFERAKAYLLAGGWGPPPTG